MIYNPSSLSEDMLKLKQYKIFDTDYEMVKFAESGSDSILFDVRRKQSPSLHRKTNRLEFGVDNVDYKKYVHAHINFNAERTSFDQVRFLIFFETPLLSDDPYVLSLGRLKEISRFWIDGVHFPEGIFFVPLDSEYVKRWGGDPPLPV